VQTFVVQIWAPVDATEAGCDGLRGFVEHVDSGRRESFRDSRELLAFFEVQWEPQPQEEER
jgi:hypothetical protein